MTVYVDAVKQYPIDMIQKSARRWGNKWSHMWTDGDVEELHAMAKRLGLRRGYFQNHHKNPTLHHYDIIPRKRELAIKYGAVDDSTRVAMKKLLTERIARSKNE